MDSESRMAGSNFGGFSRSLRRTGSLPLTNRTVRIVILGQAAVGKTAMAVRFITRRFIGEYDPTLESIYRHEALVGGDLVNFEILDTAGQEEDALLIQEKIKWGDGFLIVYSVTDRCSFDEVMRLCFLVNHLSGGRALRAVVANKRDLQYDRMVSPQEGRGLAQHLRVPFWEISARDGLDETIQVFHDLYAQLLQQGADSGPAPRRRGVSKLMERIPRLSSSSGGGGPRALAGPPAALRTPSLSGGPPRTPKPSGGPLRTPTPSGGPPGTPTPSGPLRTPPHLDPRSLPGVPGLPAPPHGPLDSRGSLDTV